MEAICVRAAANGDTVDGLLLEEYELGLAAAAVETGTLNRSVSILIQAGFNSRLAAIKVVNDTCATFQTGLTLRARLNSEAIAIWSASPDHSLTVILVPSSVTRGKTGGNFQFLHPETTVLEPSQNVL